MTAKLRSQHRTAAGAKDGVGEDEGARASDGDERRTGADEEPTGEAATMEELGQARAQNLENLRCR